MRDHVEGDFGAKHDGEIAIAQTLEMKYARRQKIGEQ